MVVHIWVGLGALIGAAGLPFAATVTKCESARVPTPKDAVELTLAREPGYYQPHELLSSPEGSDFLVLTNTGDLAHNTRTYSLRRFSIAQCLQMCRATTVAAATTSNSFPAISQVQWSADGQSFLYLAHEGMRSAQVVRWVKGKVQTLTAAPRGVVAYASSADGKTLAYIQAPEPVALFDSATDSAMGLTVTDQALESLLRNRVQTQAGNGLSLTILSPKGKRVIRLPEGIEATAFRLSERPRGDRHVLYRYRPLPYSLDELR